jgi:hypothetical protein
MATVGQVFVPGGLPSITYNPRSELRLEEHVRDYLDERHKILSLSGPTKSGKTVLLRRVVENAIWLSGGAIDSHDGFWTTVIDRLGAYTAETAETSSENASAESDSLQGGISAVGRIVGEHRDTTERSVGKRHALARQRPAHLVAREELLKTLPPIVVDDFHYIDSAVQLQIVRSLKELVFDGLPVILASVPHRAFDVVRVEKEMTGRLQQLEIPFWQEDELQGIAGSGFQALNVTADAGMTKRLTSEAFRSPHLMQEFCLHLCKENGVRETVPAETGLQPPQWDEFFRSRASGASRSSFDLLARGPRARTDRIKRILKDGTETDIYGLVLVAIAATGPLTELTYEALRASIRRVLKSDPPQSNEITSVLEQMSKIAREKIDGEPVVEYDDELSTLFISDPFFAYFLRWGTAGPLAAIPQIR